MLAYVPVETIQHKMYHYFQEKYLTE